MNQQYHLHHIRALLTTGFTPEQLRRFCHDTPAFRPVYHQLAQETGQDTIIDRLMEHAERHILFVPLLEWAKRQNPAQYEQHRPYGDRTIDDQPAGHSPGGAQSRGPTIPLQRPRRAEHFIGREAELAKLLTDLQPGQVVTLTGPGGIGKSALAAEAIWTLAPDTAPPDRFSDGMVFHNFYDQPQVELAMESIARAFGEEPKPTPRDAAQRVLAGRQALLIFDGAEDADNLPALLKLTGPCGVLITSRTSDDAPGDWQDVPRLTTAEAVTLLQTLAGTWANDQQAVQSICELVGGLPLAVSLVGRYLAHRKHRATTYLQGLKASPLKALDQGQRRAKSVPVLLERSLTQVSPAAQQALAVIGLLALNPFQIDGLAAALAVPDYEAEHILGELVSYGLLLRPTARYETGHALIHTYARRRLTAPDEVLIRLAEYYTKLAEEQSQLGPPGYAILDGERSHLVTVLERCIEREAWEAARSLVWGVDSYLDITGHWTERVAVLEMGVTTAQALGHRRDEGAFSGNLGLAYSDLGQVERAIDFHTQALAITREIGDRRGEAFQSWNLGLLYEESDPAQAVALMSVCVDYEREIGHPDAEADAERVERIKARM
ncbi:MAG: tetratricopeptide repeat protein [Anaerolineales bacterium]|nr:tetratricopeptide repeat protein [Anaerolineales bacterium]